MLKEQATKLIIGVVLILSLLGGLAAFHAATPAARMGPVGPQLACAPPTPPCI